MGRQHMGGDERRTCAMRMCKIKDRMTDEKLHEATVCTQSAVYYAVLRKVDDLVDRQITVVYMRVLDGIFP